MKVIRVSDETYKVVCRVASEQGTYLGDALDMVIFGKVNLDGTKIEKPAAKRTAKPKGPSSKIKAGAGGRASGKTKTGAIVSGSNEDPAWDEPI